MTAISLPQLAWHGRKDLKIEFPESWDVTVCNMAGHDRRRLTAAGMKKAIASPIGIPPLHEYARGRQRVVIIFDDMSRVTHVSEIVPHVLDELAAAGVGDSQVRFIAANGCHGAMTRLDFAKKLGEDVLKRFPVYNHCPFDNCVRAGKTSRGTELFINAEVMACDLKIGIGSIVPHIMAGFGGGGKIVLPGVASYQTILALHSPEGAGVNSTVTGMGVIRDNPRRRDVDEAAGIVGLDMKIDAVVNARGENVAVFAGSPRPAYAAALEEARRHYLTAPARDCDIVIANTFAKANEAISGLLVAFPSVRRQGGDIVLIANAPEGQMTHYLVGPFGEGIGGRLRLKMKPPENVKRLFIFTEYPELASRGYLEESDRISFLYDWNEVMETLESRHGGGTRVAVYPSADIQYVGKQ
jgi:nickel-dependent lactate racemase